MIYTFDTNTVSDLHKDAYGFRPSELFWEEWIGANETQRQAIWDSLERALEVSIEREREEEQRAKVRFEALVAKTIRSGARDREMALRWIMEASKCNGDWEFLCWEHGLPYRYFERG